jgi:PIN domain nuclease of toxin-antitoxin system
MDFDFDSIDTVAGSEQGIQMPVKNLTGQPMTDKHGQAVSITLKGPDSETYRKLTRAQVKKRLDRAAKGESLGDDSTLAEAEADAIEIMAACTMAWTGINDKAGEPIPCSRETARQLYQRYPIIREQVDVFISSRLNFTPVSSTA